MMVFQLPKTILIYLLTLTTLIHTSSSEISVRKVLDYSVRQYAILSERVNDETGCITVGNPLSTTWTTTGVGGWTAGFYGGSLWMLYKLTGDTYWRNLAQAFQERVRERQYDTGTHDVGFVIMSTFGLGLELTGNTEEYAPVIVQAARSLATRFVPVAGVLRSWDNDNDHTGFEGEVTVIADNMMNLELLLEAAKLSPDQDSNLTALAASHALKTLVNHFRPGGSTFHVVAYNETDGSIVRKYNHQGYADNSTWSRGLAWVIHGYTTVYEYLNDTYFLQAAEKAASYFIPRLPSDSVPYFDFDAPIASEYYPRDTAAAAIAAHAFLKLYEVTGNATYFETGERIMESLMTDSYRADGRVEYQLPALIANGTVFYYENNLNTAIVYGDFYFLRALDAYEQILGKLKDYNTA